MSSVYQKAQFLLSVAETKQLPPDQGIEIAIVGRSNAGKSSVFNRITRKGLARVSKTPGRTRLINLFGLDDTRRLADLPGYGFAKAPRAAKVQWQKTIAAYFNERKSLKGLLLIMDIRHPLKPGDLEMLDYCEHYQLPVHIILNKADKISKNNAQQTLMKTKQALHQFTLPITLQCFSALSGLGVKELHSTLNQWYRFNT